MHEQEQDVAELQAVDPVQLEDRMTVGNLTEGLLPLTSHSSSNNNIIPATADDNIRSCIPKWIDNPYCNGRISHNYASQSSGLSSSPAQFDPRTGTGPRTESSDPLSPVYGSNGAGLPKEH
ncbi:hypothetical protein TNCV_3714611 [Trichonephila clavipes]|nr:hypothetical protein TNCV_3714611 [Trichonephila clavipes]